MVLNSALPQPIVSILIVRSGSNSSLDACLDSIREKVRVPCEVIVVGTGPGVSNFDEALQPGVSFRLIRSLEDLTFAAANNLAAHHASGEFLLLLSDDAVLLTGIEDAVSVLQADPTPGAIGAERYSHRGAYLVSCGRFPTPLRLWRFASMWQIPSKTWKVVEGVAIRRCDYVDASFLLTRANVWRDVGGMEEANALYGDEMDYCRALLDLGIDGAHDAGYLTAQCPSVHYSHGGEYSPSRLGHIVGGFRRYHRRFSGRFIRSCAELALRGGLWLRIPVYWWKSRRGDEGSRVALEQVRSILRDW